MGASYTDLGQTSQLTLGTSTAEGTLKAYITNAYEPGTDRLTQSVVTDQTHGYEDQELNYAYDDAGNVTSITDPTTLGGTAKTDNQCFAYDGYQRLTDAWTPSTADCTTTGRTTANLGGAAPYWTSYTYTPSGLRATETTHTSSATTTKTYCYDASKVHQLAATTTAASCTGVTPSYAYDGTGNTTTRPNGTDTQSLTWNTTGDLDTLTEKTSAGTTTSTTSHVYDADGTLLIRRNTAGETVLYLDGITEVHLKTSGTTTSYWAQRYYSAAGTTIATRSNQSGTSTVSWLAADQHGTSTLSLNATTQAITKRYMTPFGASRAGGVGTWSDDKTFLGDTTDTTSGLTYVGAREYDSTIGRFISVDPLLETNDIQSLNGYTYGDNNPVTLSDPSGKGGLACGKEYGISCGNGNVTHGDGSLSKNGKATGGGVASGYGGLSGSSGGGTTKSSGTAGSTSTGQNSSDGQPTLGGVRVPTEKELSALPWSHDSYSWNLMTWADSECEMDPSSDVCAAANALGWIRPKGDILELLGVKDAKRCVGGSVTACIWTVAGFVPVGDLSDAARLLRGGEEAADVGRTLRTMCHSFVEGTKVLLADGTGKAIEDVKVGDKIKATDPETGKTTTRRVVATIVTKDDKDFVDLTVAAEKGKGTAGSLIATVTHPFWVASQGAWVYGGDLQVGMTLRTEDGKQVRITSVRHFRKQQTTHDLTVSRIHTYYVLAGNTPVLVHNNSCSIGSVTGPGGEVLPLPRGAAGTPVTTGKGWAYDIPAGTAGLDPRVAQVRVMDPVTTGKYQYPKGYVVYMNESGQSVNPLTGQTVGRADPYNHIPIS
ncbi:RHS repeat-associated core domain containing protein-containing protein [Actinobacteria bacterium OK074]|nr:RHS repeat-associated core domain containing protein-containing protein [Actinobacteria bacterium OK074]